jgi:hypothetical protein
MRRGQAALGLVAVALALGACGASEGTDDAADGPPDHVAESFLNALYEADGATACRLSTTEAQIDFANGDDCVANVISVLAPTGADADELQGADFDTVRQDDGEAVVVATLADGSEQRFHLVLQDGQWKIDSG